MRRRAWCAGSCCRWGRILRFPRSPVFDSTGIFMTPALRHFDRGSRQRDKGSGSGDEYVFGATGAAALYRRAMIADVCFRGEFFDDDFFAYREDADVAWRAQLLGWRCRYTPGAVAYHVRSVVPENRRQVARVDQHAFGKEPLSAADKERDRSFYRRCWLPMTARDLLVLAGCRGARTSFACPRLAGVAIVCRGRSRSGAI